MVMMPAHQCRTGRIGSVVALNGIQAHRAYILLLFYLLLLFLLLLILRSANGHDRQGSRRGRRGVLIALLLFFVLAVLFSFAAAAPPPAAPAASAPIALRLLLRVPPPQPLQLLQFQPLSSAAGPCASAVSASRPYSSSSSIPFLLPLPVLLGRLPAAP